VYILGAGDSITMRAMEMLIAIDNCRMVGVDSTVPLLDLASMADRTDRVRDLGERILAVSTIERVIDADFLKELKLEAKRAARDAVGVVRAPVQRVPYSPPPAARLDVRRAMRRNPAFRRT
jgi:hypothetical protein